MNREDITNGLSAMLAAGEVNGRLTAETLALLPESARLGIERLQEDAIAAEFAFERDREERAETAAKGAKAKLAAVRSRDDAISQAAKNIPERFKKSKIQTAKYLLKHWSELLPDYPNSLSERTLRRIL